MEWAYPDDTSIMLFMLLLARTASFFAVFPAFGGGTVPRRIKGAVAGVMCILLYSIVPPLAQMPPDLGSALLLLGREVLIGLLLGSIIHFVFMAAQFAGQTIGVQMGLSAASLFDPSTKEQVAVSGRFYYLMAIMLFLGLDLHHEFIAGLGRSFTLVPPGSASLPVAGVGQWVALSGKVLTLGVRLSMPVIGALLAVDTALGFLARIVPQMNIFLVGFPVKITVGLAVMLLGIGSAGRLLSDSLGSLLTDFYSVMSWIR
ncbi:MAG: flagellar biosynthetic protein FliR [bacterium]|nr:flagellar biosynthetic protein FliR [bacterium]